MNKLRSHPTSLSRSSLKFNFEKDEGDYRISLSIIRSSSVKYGINRSKTDNLSSVKESTLGFFGLKVWTFRWNSCTSSFLMDSLFRSFPRNFNEIRRVGHIYSQTVEMSRTDACFDPKDSHICRTSCRYLKSMKCV